MTSSTTAPEWGPAVHDPENPRGYAAIQQALDQRDAHGDRPEDN